MYKNVLRSLQDVEIYPIITLVLFSALFLVVIWYIIKMDKKGVEERKALPLDGTTHTMDHSTLSENS